MEKPIEKSLINGFVKTIREYAYTQRDLSQLGVISVNYNSIQVHMRNEELEEMAGLAQEKINFIEVGVEQYPYKGQLHLYGIDFYALYTKNQYQGYCSRMAGQVLESEENRE